MGDYMNNLTSRLLLPKFEDATEEEWEEIVNNPELRELFLKRVKEGLVFVCDKLPESLILILLTKEYIKYTMENFKKVFPKLYLNTVADIYNEEIYSDFNPEIYESLFSYYKLHKSEILDVFMQHIMESNSVSNPDWIQEIINQKMYSYAYLISVKNPTSTIEDFIIESLPYVESDLRTYSPRIEDAYINGGKSKLLERFYRNGRVSEAILSDLDQGLIDPSELSSTFINAHSKNITIIKWNLQNGGVINVHLNSELFKQHPFLIDLVISLIKRNEISRGSLFDCGDIPEIVAAEIEYLFSETDLLREFNRFVGIIPKAMALNHDLIINALVEAFKKNFGCAFKLVPVILTKDDYKDYELLIIEIVKKLTFDEILALYTMPGNYTVVPRLKEYEQYYDYSVVSLPENINLKRQYSEKILLSIIPKMDIEQLVPGLDSWFYDSSALVDAIVKRLIELKSKSFNNDLYLLIDDMSSQTYELIISENNPLGLTYGQLLKLCPEAIDRFGTSFFDIFIPSNPVVSESDFRIIMSKIISYKIDSETGLNVFDFNDKKLEILEKLLTLNIGNEQGIYSCISWTLQLSVSSEEYFDKIKSLFREFLYNRKSVPLILTNEFDKELREHSTYDINSLSTNPDLFTPTKVCADFRDFVIECINKNYPIDFSILYSLFFDDVENHHLMDYDNTTFESKASIEIIKRLLYDNKLLLEKPIEQSCILRWFSKTAAENIASLLENNGYRYIIFNTESILSIVISRLESYSHMTYPDIIYSLFKDYSPDFKTKLLEYIHHQIQNNRMYGLNIKMSDDLLELSDPIIESFLVEKYFEIGFADWLTDPKMYELVRHHPKYYNAFLESVSKEPSKLDTCLDYVLKYPDLKNFYIGLIRDGKIKQYDPIREFHFDIEVMSAILNRDSTLIKQYISALIHQEGIISLVDDEAFNIMVDPIVDNYSINKDSLILFRNVFGNEILRTLENDQILELLSKDSRIVQKFIEIFKVRKLDKPTVEAVNDSIQQNIYTMHNPTIINLFGIILEKIQNGITEDDICSIISMLCEKDENGNYLYFLESIEISDEELAQAYRDDKELFIRLLIKRIAINQNIYGPILHTIVSHFIAEKREEITRGEDIFRDTNVRFTYDTKQLYESFFKFYLETNPDGLLDVLKEGYQKGYDGDPSLDRKTIDYLRNSRTSVDEEEILKIRKNVISIKKRLNELFFCTLLPMDIDEKYLVGVKKHLSFPERKISMDELNKINLDSFFQLIEDKDKYECLIRLLDKYKILEWGDIFDDSIEQLSFDENDIEIYNFINAFSTIYDIEYKLVERQRQLLIEETVVQMKAHGCSREEIAEYVESINEQPIVISINPFKILKYSSIYSSIANGYKVFFGLDDFDFIRRDPPKYPSHDATVEQRLEYNANLYINMIQTDEVTIPSFVKEHSFEENKKRPLRAIVGCKADSRNLTLGERTGACMRAYGYDHDLFTFTNSDPRGFHIVFEDPEDGKFISRVSGFRNGNTVFFNQLRFSVDSTRYTTEDVIETFRDIAQEIIEHSKDSEMPIENVVCSPGYALEGSETQELSRQDIGAGVYSGRKDVTYNAVVIATTGTNGRAMPLKLDGEHQPIYKPCRLPLRYYEYPNISEEVKVLIQRVNVLKKCIAKQDSKLYLYEDLDFEILDSEYYYVILGQDFYVALDSRGKIIHNIAVETEESINEYNAAIKEVEEYRNRVIGGLGNGKRVL